MEFPFDINPLFPERVTVLDHHLQPGRRSSSSRATLENQLTVVLDKMGEASAKAQQLSAAITNASRMQVNRHRLYILKDGLANRGRGTAIGFLKVGNKKLFVLDGQGAHNEMEPLCVLDFFVHVSLQRHGYGKELFDYMIQYEGVQPHHLAIDRPSSKFLSFLRKHYRLAATIPQVNNFVVFDSFFRDRQLRGARLIHRSAPKKVEQDIKPYSITVRDGAPREQELPWPFNQSPSLTRSNSLGRASRQEAGRPPSQQEGPRHVRGALNGRREQEDPSAHRTRTSAPCEVEDVVAARSLGAVHTPTPPSPEHGPHTASQPLPHQNLSGQSQPPVFRGPDPCSGDSSPPPRPVPRLDLKALPGYPGSPEKRPSTSASLHDPPPAPRGRHGPGPGPGPERRGGDAVPAARSPGKQLGVPGPWPAVMEMELPTQAQWIRHKNKFRNTRPW